MKSCVIFKTRNCDSLSTHLQYQKYYFEGFNSLDRLNFRISPSWIEKWIKLGSGRIPGKSFIWNKLLLLKNIKGSDSSYHVGKYLVKMGQKSQVKVAIDASDMKSIQDREAYKWSDIYFKSNMWANLRYPRKTHPLINGNGFLSKTTLEHLEEMRNLESSYDLIYWAKIWEPGNIDSYSKEKCRKIISHQVKLFKTLAKLNCKKSLLAIFPHKQIKSINTQECIRALTDAGVKCQYGWGKIDSLTFWQTLARSKIIFIRPGNHMCISWRLIGLFCLGSCIVYDGAPTPQWYKPILSGQHYLDGNCSIRPNYSLPSDKCYENLILKIENLLSDPEKILELKANAASYYDHFGSPAAVAKHILKTAGNLISANSNKPFHKANLNSISDDYLQKQERRVLQVHEN